VQAQNPAAGAGISALFSASTWLRTKSLGEEKHRLRSASTTTATGLALRHRHQSPETPVHVGNARLGTVSGVANSATCFRIYPRAGGRLFTPLALGSSTHQPARKHPRRACPDGDPPFLHYGATRRRERCCIARSPDRHPASNSAGWPLSSGFTCRRHCARRMGMGAYQPNIRNFHVGQLRLNGIPHGQPAKTRIENTNCHNTYRSSVRRDCRIFKFKPQIKGFAGLW